MVSDKVVVFIVSLMLAGSQYVSAKHIPIAETKDNGPTLPTDDAALARYIVHNSDWVSIGTNSIAEGNKGYPFVGLKSIADGPSSNGTGVLYMYMTNLDISMHDLNADNRTTLFMSLAQDSYCKNKNYDPQDPRCPRVMMTGTIERVQNSDEETFAKNALFEKHPSMKFWPLSHGFFIVKLNVQVIRLMAGIGGMRTITTDEYFAARAPANSEK